MSKVKLGEVAIEHKETCKGKSSSQPLSDRAINQNITPLK